MIKSVIIRTHGGLGNQLFLVFFAVCFCIENNVQVIKLIHDSGYPHAFGSDDKLIKIGKKPTFIEEVISSMRIPKIMKKLFKESDESIKLLSNLFLDGYFQDPSSYKKYSNKTMSKALERIRDVLECDKITKKSFDLLVHVRLGDFFKSKDEELIAARSIVQACDQPCHMITNHEDILKEAIALSDKNKSDYHVISTSQMSSRELMNLMGKYICIKSNNSTLAVWAAIIFKRKLIINNKKLINFFNMFKDVH